MTRSCICPGNFVAKKRNQLSETSCNTCGGSFLVDGVGVFSANMLSTVGLEVPNSISPELNWKKVTKGRSSRKPIGRSSNWGGKLKNQSPRRVGDFSGSDSDKIPSKQRAPDKVLHIPIKKRRHLLRSKSSSQVPFGQQEDSVSPHLLASPTQSEELELLTVHNHPSGLSSCDYSSNQLAALKLCNGIRDSTVDAKFTEISNVSYYNSEDFSGIALLAAAACSNDMDDDSVTEKEGCFIKASLTKDSRNQLEKDTTPESKGECSDSLKTLSVITHRLDEDNKQRKHVRSVSPKVERLYWDLNTSMEAWELPCDDQAGRITHNDGDSRQKEKLVTDSGEQKLAPDVYQHDSENLVSSAETDTKIAPLALKMDVNNSGLVSCLNRTSVKEILKKDTEPLGTFDKGISLGDPLANKSIHASIIDEDHLRTCELMKHMVSSKATVGDVQLAAGEVKWQKQVASASIVIGDSQVLCKPKRPSSRWSDECVFNEEEHNCLQGSSKFFKEGAKSDLLASQSIKMGSFLEDCHKSDISHEDRGQTIGSEDMHIFHAGYDSPFEDGELRGSSLCCWEENEIDGEVDCVGYDSDGNGMYSDAADHHGSEVVEAGSEGSQGSEKRLSSVSRVLEEDFRSRSLKNLRVQTRRCGSDEIDGENKGSDAGFGTMIHNSADFVRKRPPFGFRWAYNEEFGLRTDRGKSQSRIEGALYFDAKDRKDSIRLHQRRPHSLGCSYTRPERDFSPEKFVGRYRSPFHERGGWGSKNRYPSTYTHATEDHRHSRRKSFADLADRFGGGMDSRDQRQSINYYSSKGIERPPGFRCYDGPRRMVPVRGGIFYRNSRGGSGSYYSQKSARGGFRQEGNFPLSRRDRSFSPQPGKVGPFSFSRRKSRSPSRSSSPQAWHSQRDWNPRRHVRSPELRAVSRIERMRVPFKRVADYGEGFVSPSRRQHLSPDRKSRWVDDQRFVGSHLRHGRSPVREMRRSQRYDVIGPDRFKSDEHFRPSVLSRRFPSMGSTRRVTGVEDNYNDSRQGGAMMHRGRRTGSDAGGKLEAMENDEDTRRDAQGTDRVDEDDNKSFKIQQ